MKDSFNHLDKYRVTEGFLASEKGKDLRHGAFRIPLKDGKCLVIATDGNENGVSHTSSEDPTLHWEHVSISFKHRCPTWAEMCKIKDMFWDSEEAVVQFHPPKSTHVNNHPNCLHLWKMVGKDFPLPDPILVGVPGIRDMQHAAQQQSEVGKFDEAIS